MDFRLASRFLEDHDFYEGVRAVVIDKDNAPAWKPASLEALTSTAIDRYFEDGTGASWSLPTRAEMQAMRA
jgi:enoyl-CoA hydratase